jgi:hypothetical protein
MNLANWQETDEKVNGLSLYSVRVNSLSSHSVKVDMPGLKVREVLQSGVRAVRWCQNVTTAVPRMEQRQSSPVGDQPVRVLIWIKTILL